MTITPVESIMLSSPDHTRLPIDPEFQYGAAFANGQYSDITKATVPLLDMGFNQADAAYDVVSVSKGYFFRLDEHLDRFERACEKFLLTNPYGRQETIDILTELVRLSGTREAYVWWAVTRGFLRDHTKRTDPASYDHRFYAYAVPYKFISTDEQRQRGIEMHVSKQYIRIPPKAVDPTAKNFHWMDLKLSLFEAGAAGKEWSVLCDDQGYLTEAPGTNIFIIKNGEVFTPGSGCLEGITRKTSLELAQALGYKTWANMVHVDQLYDADEAFMTSTAGGIMPINSADGHVLGGVNGPGAITTRLHNLYWEKRWEGWLGTPVNYQRRPASAAI